jgi:hypothetical protein
MSGSSFTLAAIQDLVFRKYGRGGDQARISETFAEELYIMVGRLMANYPYWFMIQEPGGIVPGLFPFATPPVYTEYAEASWIDVGWFHSVQGQRDFYFSTPSDTGHATDSTYWGRCNVAGIDSIQEFQLAGGRPRQIQVLDYTHFLDRANWNSSQGEPEVATLVTLNGQSLVRFNITCDTANYLYAVRFILKDLPAFDNPDQANLLFRYHPEFAIAAGCVLLAETFRDFEGAQYWELKLKGGVDPNTGHRIVGIMEEMKAESRKRYQTQNDVQEVYTSPPYDSQRSWRTSPTGGWYPDTSW